ncbi:MAG: hypothetical protein WC876_03740 [Candidatus Thermoplasmatota archaeon]
MKCFVCREDLVDEESLTCKPCRDFAIGRRLHPGSSTPKTWKDGDVAFSAYLSRLDALAYAHGIPPPVAIEEAVGAWAHFVLALDYYHHHDYESARAEARQSRVQGGAGFAGLQEHAAIIEVASTEALAGKVRDLSRRYRVHARIDLPALTLGTDFQRPAWACYQDAIDAVRATDFKQAYKRIDDGLLAAGGRDAVNTEVQYLKELGRAISRSRKRGRRFALHIHPSRAQDVLAVFDYFGVPAPSEPALANPAWATLAKAHIAHDNGAWQTCYAYIDEARALMATGTPELAALAKLLRAVEESVPVAKRPANYAIRRKGRIHKPVFARLRQKLDR